MPTPTIDAPLLDTDTVAQVLGVTRRHVQRLVSERRIPFIKVGRSFDSTRPHSTCGSISS